MKITQEIRDEFGSARSPNTSLAAEDLDQAMAEKAEEFKAKGSQIYLNDKGEKREPID